MKYFFKILSFAKVYKKEGISSAFFNVLYAVFSTLSMVSLIPMLNVMFGDVKKNNVKPSYEEASNIKAYFEDYMSYFYTVNTEKYGAANTLTYVVAIIIGLFLFKNVFSFLATYFMTLLKSGIIRDLRNTIYNKILDLPIAYFSEKRKGDLIARATVDVNEVQGSFLAALVLVVREPLTILFTIATMFLISTKLTLFVFLFIPISGMVISSIGKKIKKHSGRVQESQGRFLSMLEETIGGLKIIKGFHVESFFYKKFSGFMNDLFKLQVRLDTRQSIASPLSEFMGILVISVLLWYGGRLVLVEKSINASAFIGYMGLAYNLLTPAKTISKTIFSIRKGDAAAERILYILERDNPLKDKSNAVDKNTFDDKIVFDNIQFAYDKKTVINHFSLEIKKGQTVALVGQSGSGKSTLANLLTRFYDVNQGSISIDGVDIKDLSTKSLRGLLGLVTQDAILFNDSVQNNIALGIENPSFEDIKKAADIANASEFINELPELFEQSIGEGGNNLSGGQKQRLSIARAIMKNPPIMILDEATSALDTASEKLVQNALENMMKNRTSLVIAHRLSTIQNADLIVVMDHGKIVEKGKHEELMAAKGNYFQLVNMQEFK